MFTIIWQLQGGASRPHLSTYDTLSCTSVDDAKSLASEVLAELLTKGFRVARLIGIRDRKTGRFVA